VLRARPWEGPILTSTVAATRQRNGREPTLKASSAIKVSDQTIKKLTGIFKMMADRSRLKILLALAQDGELHVTALCDMLKQSQPAVSHHLTLMRSQNLVDYRRDGKHNFYRLDSAVLRDLLEQFFADAGNGPKQFTFDEFVLAYKRK
jgi:ArsR family transcriptional regulator, arsenate/arsenite/antimonite-responsive transcriptional repressor